MPGDRNGCAEQRGLADDAARRDDPRQQLALDAEEREQLVVPVEIVQSEQQRPRRVRHVDDVRVASCQLPDEPRVDGPEREVPL